VANWEEITLPDIVKFDTVGDKMEGEYIAKDTIPYEDQTFDVYIFRQDDGSRWSTSASGGLAPLMRDIPFGTYVQIEMTGQKDTGKESLMKTFAVRKRSG
jgi:hypothetical protein